MSPDAESRPFVVCTDRLVLECRCGERLVLLGLEEDWYAEGRTAFECECGDRLTLADRSDLLEGEPGLGSGDLSEDQTRSVRELLRGLRAPSSN